MSGPPDNSSQESELSKEQAELSICRGALLFEGLYLQSNHTPLHYKLSFYATVNFAADGEQSEANYPPCSTIADASLWLGGQPLEQPCMLHCFGESPGTVTINRHVNAISGPVYSDKSVIDYNKIIPRHTDGLLVLERLTYLMKHGWDEAMDVAERFLFTELVYDPSWEKDTPARLRQQIWVLNAALNHPTWWIDFSNPKSQVLTRHHDTKKVDLENRFWQQLLLSVELNLRLRAVGGDEQRKRMIALVSEKVAWDLALSGVWLSKMALVTVAEGPLRTDKVFHITARTEDTQKERLIHFARNMKWVGMHEVEEMLEKDSEGRIRLESQNAYAASWINSLILPGPSVYWLAMRSLISADTDIINEPHGFDDMPPNYGFQYSGATYWYFENIVGKVLGAAHGVYQDYGWIGPCIPSPDLKRLETVLIRTDPAPTRRNKRHRSEKIARRTHPLGPPAASYPFDDYVLPDTSPSATVNNIRVQKLSFLNHILPRTKADPTTYDAAVLFAVGGKNVHIRLRYDVSFVHAPPCAGGPHRLYWKYAFHRIGVDELSVLDLHSWEGVFVDASERHGRVGGSGSDGSPGGSSGKGSAKKVPKAKSILVVEAFGHEDNEVLARAWAAHVGFSAVVAKGKQTCVACAVRMAYAASVNMVILGEEKREGEE